MHKPYEPATRLAEALLQDRLVERIWARDATVWKAAPGSADEQSIATRLGWLDAPVTMAPHLDRLRAFREDIHRGGHFDAAYLLGMGGSSLCAEVLRSIFGSAPGHPDLIVLDTTDERTLTSAVGHLTPERTLFIVASKSGGTIEVAAMERYFWTLMSQARGIAGRHFVAVTDPDTGLDRLARERGYCEVFLNPPDIGGRFSALSLFGLVPAAVLGASVEDLRDAGSAMAEGCRQNNHTNAGLELGAFIAGAASSGRDKLTLLLAPSLRSLGLWIEQLVAESTGKHGTGVLPVVDEAAGPPDVYGADRAFVSVATAAEHHDEEFLSALESAGHPVLRLSTRIDGLGAEFFRWEFATAVAGAALGINPFDEPNVAEAKEQTRGLLEQFAASGAFVEPPFGTGEALAQETRAVIASLAPPDYVAFLSYLPADAELNEAVANVRSELRARKKVATTFGTGPRYLHSTGQYHKGGPDHVVAFVITTDDETGTAIPDAGYSFSVLKRAQALGDIQALRAHGRRVVRIHLPSAESAPLAVMRLFEDALR